MNHTPSILLAIACMLTPAGAISGETSQASHIIDLSGDGWQAAIDADKGTIITYTQDGVTIPFRTDSLSGPSWYGVELKPSGADPLFFYGNKDAITYTLKYDPAIDHLTVRFGIRNNTDTVFAPESASAVIGIDSEMHSFPQWNDRHFPTLMRCEHDFAWGYFMSPQGSVMAVGVEQPVASYTMNYIYRGIKDWMWGHQIFTASWDLLHRPPLPPRHPAEMDRLLPGEHKLWTMHIGCVDTDNDVKPTLAYWLSAPIAELDRYTVAAGEANGMSIYSDTPIASIECTDPDSIVHQLNFEYDAPGVYTAAIPGFQKQGQYAIRISDIADKQSEATFYVRGEWADYLRQARDVVMKHPPLMGNSCEAFYGYYPAFLAARHFPIPEDSVLESRFTKAVNLLVDTVTGLPAEKANPARIQNFSSIIGIMTDLHDATGNEQYLILASRIGDYLSSGQIQADDGSYRSHGAHYTSVIYPAKSMLELADAEELRYAQTSDPIWQQRAARHHSSAMRAIGDLADRRDNIGTEGDMTFEDGMVSCSALQLALGAIHADNDSIRDRLREAAEYMLTRHQCLEQNQITDARMRGATLRYWEALDIYFSPNQAMNSPHGWTAWKIYAVYYMYLLTGDKKYLNDLNDTLGACAQLMTPDGHLRWGFIPDPYINGRICRPAASEPKGSFEYTDSVIGEQYLDMISPWMRPENEFQLCNFSDIGGAGDHTVYEIFKALEETAISTAYVRVTDPDGEPEVINCTATLSGNMLDIKTDRHIRRTHIYTEIPIEVAIDGKNATHLPPGSHLIE